jgi:hypothetical protein
MDSFERREQKRRWAQSNPDKVRQSNRNWRFAFQKRYNDAARERMRRYRRRLRVT